MADIRRTINDLCGDYPGAVVVRQSFETFERLVRMDDEEIRLSISNEKVVGTVISGAEVGGADGKYGKTPISSRTSSKSLVMTRKLV